MTTPVDPTRGSLGAAVESLLLQVDRETVLQARAAVLAEADRLEQTLFRFSTFAPLGECGIDPVSRPAARAFNERISPVVSGCRHYVEQLRATAAVLAISAHRYGYSEQEIANSFRT